MLFVINWLVYCMVFSNPRWPRNSNFAPEINEKEEKMKADSITSPIRKQGFRASMTVKW